MGVEPRQYRGMHLTDLVLPRAIGLSVGSSAMFAFVSKPAGVERAGPLIKGIAVADWLR